MSSGGFDPARILSALASREVRFVLIGEMAAVLHGDVGVTVALDIVPERSDANLEQLAHALGDLGACIRTDGEPSGRPFDCSAEFLENRCADSILKMSTEAGDLDVTFCPSGTQGFADLQRDAIEIEAAERLHIRVASLEDVIRSKQASVREKDRLAVPRLRRLLDRLGADG